ncbi:hypothetical protein [Cryptosporangium japonicum]|uniref:hypothetical protein n=1 Tax=Cryptosporangium japonicum TaxID=80872 RepID=UPI0031D64A5A
MKWLSAQRWEVVHARRFRVNRWAVRALWQYQWNTATRDRREMADRYMSATDSLVLVLRVTDESTEWACTELTRAKGGSDPLRCRPGQLRHALGTLNQQLNLVHSADEPADLIREIGICCPAEERSALYTALADGADAWGEAFALAHELEAGQELRDLSLSGTVEQVLARAGRSTELHDCLTRLSAGDEVSWPAVSRAAERSGVDLGDWERIVLGTYLLVPTLAGVTPLLPDGSAHPPELP